MTRIETYCEQDGSLKAYRCLREEQCDDCWLVDHLKMCSSCDAVDHPMKRIPVKDMNEPTTVMGVFAKVQESVEELQDILNRDPLKGFNFPF